MKWRKWWRMASKASLARSLIALWFMVRDPRSPRMSKLIAWAVLAYALSPIDLIPDFIPILGQLDDLVIVPLGVMMAVRLVPDALWREFLHRADGYQQRLPRLKRGLILVLMVWLVLLIALVWWLLSIMGML